MTRHRPDPEETLGDPRDIAAGWFARRRSGDLTAADEAALQAWLEASPAHRRAYDSMRLAWAGAGALRTDPQVLALRERWAGPAARRRSALGPIAAAVLAAACLATAGGAGWIVWSGPHPLKDQSFQTAVGEQSRVTLPDGSELILGTDSVVRTQADRERRLVYLERGQAYFKVAHDPARPFVVAAGGKTVTALGTAFEVRLDSGQVKVTLVEGRVRVETPLPPPVHPGDRPAARAAGVSVASAQTVDMTAGSQLIAPPSAEWRVTAANVVVETSWTRGQLIFDDAALATVVEELNRYSDKKIVIDDKAVERARISGVFRPGQVDSFVRTIEAYRIARADEGTAEAVHLRAY